MEVWGVGGESQVTIPTDPLCAELLNKSDLERAQKNACLNDQAPPKLPSAIYRILFDHILPTWG